MPLQQTAFWKHSKKRHFSKQAISPFITMFSTLFNYCIFFFFSSSKEFWERKTKLLDLNNFSLSHNVFKSSVKECVLKVVCIKWKCQYIGEFFFLSTAEPRIVKGPQNVGVDINGDTSLECRAQGLPIPKLFWKRKDGKKLDLGGKMKQLPSGALQITGFQV